MISRCEKNFMPNNDTSSGIIVTNTNTNTNNSNNNDNTLDSNGQILLFLPEGATTGDRSPSAGIAAWTDIRLDTPSALLDPSKLPRGIHRNTKNTASSNRVVSIPEEGRVTLLNSRYTSPPPKSTSRQDSSSTSSAIILSDSNDNSNNNNDSITERCIRRTPDPDRAPYSEETGANAHLLRKSSSSSTGRRFRARSLDIHHHSVSNRSNNWSSPYPKISPLNPFDDPLSSPVNHKIVVDPHTFNPSRRSVNVAAEMRLFATSQQPDQGSQTASARTVWGRIPTFMGKPAITTTTTATASPSIPMYRDPRKSTNWWEIITRGEPVRLLTTLRCAFLLPVTLYLVGSALFGSDWKHMEYIDHNLHQRSKTVLSLWGVEKITESRGEGLVSANTITELPISYRTIRGSHSVNGNLFCDRGAHNDAIRKTLAEETSALDVLTGAKIKDRDYRLLVYEAMYGPTFRNIDCRQLFVLESAGLCVRICLYVMLIALSVEWIITALYLMSPRREGEAIAAFRFATKSHAVPSDLPREDTNPIVILGRGDGTKTQYDDESLEDENPREATGAMTMTSPTVIVRQEPNGAQQSSSGFRTCMSSIRRKRRNNWSGWSTTLWWMPLTWLQTKTGIHPVQGSRRFYYCISFLEGTTTFLSTLQLLLITICLLVWTGLTRNPACLDQMVELRGCHIGYSFFTFLSAYTLTLIGWLCHLYSAQILIKLNDMKKNASSAPAA